MYDFPERTSWSMVRALGDASDPSTWQTAWTWLHTRYRPAMVLIAKRFLGRGLGAGAASNEAEDVVEAFLLACVEKQWLLRADRDHGRFRVFAYVLLARFTRDWIREARALKRRPATGEPASLDPTFPEPETPGDAAVDGSMDLEWVLCMVHAALDRVEARSEGNAVLLRLLLGGGDVPKDVLAETIGCRSAQIPVRTFRARRMLAEELWVELQHTVSSEEALRRERDALAPYLEGYLDPKAEPSFFFGAPGGSAGPDDDSLP